jgi:hypothetical protein
LWKASCAFLAGLFEVALGLIGFVLWLDLLVVCRLTQLLLGDALGLVLLVLQLVVSANHGAPFCSVDHVRVSAG